MTLSQSDIEAWQKIVPHFKRYNYSEDKMLDYIHNLTELTIPNR